MKNKSISFFRSLTIIHCFFAVFLILITFVSCKDSIAVNQVPMAWNYDVPATKYWEGLPIGTGRFGAMIPGSVGHEVIAFNDETLWTGGPYNPNNPEGPEILKKIREHAFAHNWLEATNETRKMGSTPEHVQIYQAMARLNILWEGQDLSAATGYRRALSMDSALVRVDYTHDGVRYSRRIFASYPDQTIVMRFTANKKGKISIDNWFTSHQPSAVTRVEGDEIIIEGTTISEQRNMVILPPKMKWQAKLKVIPEGGVLSKEGDRLILRNANAVTLILAGATNWVNWNDISANAIQRCNDYITNASKRSYKELLRRHLEDYCPLFATCSIDLGPDPAPSQTTTQRMEAIRAGALDPAYEARYFQYGRYLMLAAARENTLAFNNHNIWLDDLRGRWQGRWTLNINIQECYWPVESTNLPRINESLLLFVDNLAQAGQRTAKELYGCRGWCAHHGTDIWFNTAPTDGNPQHAMFPLAGVWLMQQLYDHYLYNPDPEYLKRIYPLMKGAVEFCVDFLVEDPSGQYLVTCPASSPENSFCDENGSRVSISYGSAGDMQLIRNIFRNYIHAASRLDLDPQLKLQVTNMLNRFPPHKIGSLGQLQEWFYDFREAEVTHRHIQHLFAVYPDDDITLRKTPELIPAVRKTLERRGGSINMGWSGAWKINLHARLEEPEEAYSIYHKMLTDVSIHPRAEDSRVTPSFEGNQAIQGITAGVVEMLMQSHSGELSLLPALPVCWKNGAVRGLRARGGYDIDIAWNEGALTKAVIKANYDGICRLRTKTPVKISSSGQKVTVETVDKSCVSFAVKAGKTYIIEGATGKVM